MKTKHSEITGRDYNPFTQIRILNPRQAAWYIFRKCPLQDIEISEDRRTGDKVVVFIFNREDTVTVFDEWVRKKYD